jgi:hypothetical protein
MNFLNYSLTAVVSYLGLFVGLALAFIAKEELKDGKKYFIFMQKVILSIVFVFLFVFDGLSYILVLLLIGCIVVYYLKNYLKKKFDDVFYNYIILAGVFLFSLKELNLFIIESSLIFLYGLPTGSLYFHKDKKKVAFNMLKNIIFVLVAVVLFFVL